MHEYTHKYIEANALYIGLTTITLKERFKQHRSVKKHFQAVHKEDMLGDVTKCVGLECSQSTFDSEGFNGGTRGAPIMPRDAVSRAANVGTWLRKRNGGNMK